MVHSKWAEKADKLMEMSEAILDILTDNSAEVVTGRMLENCSKVVELAHYLYEIAMMKKKLYPHDDYAKPYDKEYTGNAEPATMSPETTGNPKPRF